MSAIKVDKKIVKYRIRKPDEKPPVPAAPAEPKQAKTAAA